MTKEPMEARSAEMAISMMEAGSVEGYHGLDVSVCGEHGRIIIIKCTFSECGETLGKRASARAEENRDGVM